MIKTSMSVWLLLAYILTQGCANVPRDAGFPEVEQTVVERTGHHVQWNQGTAADRQAEEAVRQLLQRELTAGDAVQVALLSNQNLQATYEDLGIAQAELVEAGLLSNPTISAEIRFPHRPNFPFEIDVTQAFLDLIYLPLRSAAAAAFEGAKLRVTDAVLKTAAEVKAAFYRVQGAGQLVEVRRIVVAATEASFEAASRLHEAGNITDLAFAEERAMHEQAKIDLARAEAHSLDTREDLNALMGVWGSNTQWTINSLLPDLPGDEIESEGLESLAAARRLDLAASRQDVERAAQSLGLTKSSALFSDATFTFHTEGEPDGTITSGPGIELPLPIFNQGQPAIAAAQARLRQSQRRYAALAIEVRSQVRRLRNRMLAACDLANYYRQVIIPLRHQIVEENQLQYNAMTIGVFQLLHAKRSQIDAGREYVEALQDYWVTRAELERAVGGTFRRDVPSTQPATNASHSDAPSEETKTHPHIEHGAKP